MKRYIINIILVILLIFASLRITNAEEERLPSFQPSIKDKLDKMKTEKFELVQPLRESDLVKIIFTKDWILKNDEDSRPEIIKITFPIDWVNKNMIINNESVLLKIPKRMLESEDLNEDVNQITVSYPIDMFKFEDISQEMVEKIEKEEDKKEFQFNISQIQINHEVRAFYKRDSFYETTRVRGDIDPYNYYNTGVIFTNYNEREIYLDRESDVIEFISEFSSSDGVTTKAYIWIAIYDEGQWTAPNNRLLLVDVTPDLRSVEYHLNIINGVYEIWIIDLLKNKFYNYNYNDDDPGSYIKWLIGSTELAENGINNYFVTHTRPIRDDWTFASNIFLGSPPNWYRPKETFDWISYFPGQVGNYVFINAWWDEQNRINTEHIAASYLQEIIEQCLENTPPGYNINVMPIADVFIYFDLVIKCGNTEAVRLGPSYYNENLSPLSPLYEPIEFYEIWTTAKYIYNIDVAVYYDPPPDIVESTIKMLHYEGGKWKDVTIDLDTNINRVKGRVSSLSLFAIVGLHPNIIAGQGLNLFWSIVLIVFLLIISVFRLNRQS